MAKSEGEVQTGDAAILKRFRQKLNDGRSYGKVVDGVFTWDAAEIFTDYRAVVQTAQRALKEAEQR